MSGPRRPAFNPPELLTAEHDVAGFSCDEPALDNWLKRHALKNNARGASRTFVVTVGRDVVGFVALAVGAINHAAASGALRRNMPDPVPVVVLARLAVHVDWQGLGLGGSLLREAVLRSLQAGRHVGIRGMVVHALHDRARAFYEAFGFRPSRLDDMTLMAPLEGLREHLGLTRSDGN